MSRVEALEQFVTTFEGVSEDLWHVFEDDATTSSSGGISVERRGPVVVLSIAAVDFGSSYLAFPNAIPVGYRPQAFIYENMSVNNGSSNKQVDVLSSGNVRVRAGESGAVRGAMVWLTNDDWPS